MSTPAIQPLLFGGDINVYSVARAFHEAYGVKSIAYGIFPAPFPCVPSAILDYRCCPENEDPAAFLRNVKAVAAEHPDKTVLVMGCGDSYVKLAAHLKDQFPANARCNYIDADMLDRLINKEYFYQLCDKYGIDHPATFIYEGSMGHDFSLPCICQSWEELLAALDLVYAAGYPGKMILQEFIPGDDTYMRVLTNYSDTHGKVKLMCLGHTLLEEHSPHGIGNHAVIITEYDKDLTDRIRGMLEDLHYVGFSNFDIKYDQRDGKYKVFEINCRQGRSNYYVTGSGQNIAKYLVGDLVEGKDLPLTVTKNQSLWRMIPLFAAYKFIPKRYHAQMKALAKAGADHHSVVYPADNGFDRTWRVWKNHIGNYVRFSKYCKKPED